MDRIDLVRYRAIRCDADCGRYAVGRHAPCLAPVVCDAATFLAAVDIGYAFRDAPGPTISCGAIEALLCMDQAPRCLRHYRPGCRRLDRFSGRASKPVGQRPTPRSVSASLVAQVLQRTSRVLVPLRRHSV